MSRLGLMVRPWARLVVSRHSVWPNGKALVRLAVSRLGLMVS